MLLRFLSFKPSLSYHESILCLLLLASLIFQGTNDLSVLLITYSLILLAAITNFSHLRTQMSLQLTPFSLLLVLWIIWIWLPFVFGVVSNTTLFGFFQCSLWVFAFFIVNTTTQAKRFWSLTFGTIWVLSAICAAYAIFQFFILHEMPCGFFANKNTAAAFFMMSLLTLIGEFLTQKSGNNTTSKLYAHCLRLSILIITLAMLAAFSRGVAISFVCCLTLELLLLRRYISKRRFIQLLSLLLLAFSIILIVAQPAIKHRLTLLQQEKSRLIIWQGAWHLWQKSSWYGIGIFNFMHYYPAFSLPGDGSALQYAHNDFLQLFIETGIPGALILLGLVITIALSFWRYFFQKPVDAEHHIQLAVCFAVIISFALHSMVDFNFYVLTMNLLLGCYLGYLHSLLKEGGIIRGWVIPLTPQLKRIFMMVGFILFLLITLYAFRLLLLNYYITKADVTTKQNDYTSALHYNKQALEWLQLAELHSRSADLYFQLITNTHVDSERHALIRQAEDEINKALRANHYYARPYFQMALLQSSLLYNPTKAQTFFHRSLQNNPHFCLARITFSQFLIEQGNISQAQHILEDGLYYPIPAEQAVIYLNYLAKLRYANNDKDRAWRVINRLKHLSYYNNDYSELL
ncbi:O-antigen ligase family protein [Legionella hackeliae]|uniref:Putative O-antigen ligase n=1 Tax=Legionella hackeliae TaxID=449 RepID=A0A0A8UT03_LEGHA|nr:O-antigen ligase family protein [Legionella hackeliae]KTD08778.1 O-Antigen ligase [Legionella hackeliae]CEK10207.1 putative O-antigen ligase [Legionella hackeliae]STX46933.1 Lipid A core - O-antigen ligase and related enzymes [Legionella hackeliae]